MMWLSRPSGLAKLFLSQPKRNLLNHGQEDEASLIHRQKGRMLLNKKGVAKRVKRAVAMPIEVVSGFKTPRMAAWEKIMKANSPIWARPKLAANAVLP